MVVTGVVPKPVVNHDVKTKLVEFELFSCVKWSSVELLDQILKALREMTGALLKITNL